MSQPCLEPQLSSRQRLPPSLEPEAPCRHHPSPSPLPLSPHRCLEEAEAEAGNRGEAEEAGARREAEVGCREEEAGMETRGMRRRAEEVLQVLLGLEKGNVFVNTKMASLATVIEETDPWLQPRLWGVLRQAGPVSVSPVPGCPLVPRNFPPRLETPTGRPRSDRSHRNTACAL